MVVSLGADALGFIFAPSKRLVKPEKVKNIVAGLPQSVEKIGVFLNHKVEEVVEIAEFCGLTGLQFHGEEPPAYCKKFISCYQVIKAFRVDKQTGWDKIAPYLEGNAINRILLDTYVPGVPGGTGKAFAWEIVTTQNWEGVPVILAGGINPSNVKQAIKTANPFGIDVGSSVESEPGEKDADKLKQLFLKVKGELGDKKTDDKRRCGM